MAAKHDPTPTNPLGAGRPRLAEEDEYRVLVRLTKQSKKDLAWLAMWSLDQVEVPWLADRGMAIRWALSELVRRIKASQSVPGCE